MRFAALSPSHCNPAREEANVSNRGGVTLAREQVLHGISETRKDPGPLRGGIMGRIHLEQVDR
jgi:hypothetical protein